jgi:hypothetical protein
MATDKSLVFRMGNLVGMGMRDINGDDTDPNQRPGSQSYVVDAFGPRVFEYGRNTSGSAVLVGELMELEADGANVVTTTITNITAGSRTSATTTGLTADNHTGMLAFMLDNDDAAGAAPEGETSIVADNSSTVITMEPDYPFSVALAANDDLELIANWQFEDSVDGDEAWTMYGVVVGIDGISSLNYGWIQREGYCSCKGTANAMTEGDPVVAGAAAIDAFGTDGQELWVGVALASTSTDEAIPRIPVRLKLLTCAGPGGTP